MKAWFCNGERVSELAIGDRAFQYGDGLFETVAVRNGAPRLWDYHLERLEVGCEKLQLIKPDRRQLRDWLDDAMRHCEADTSHCTAKLILSAGMSDRGYRRDAPARTTAYVGLFPSLPLPSEHYRDGVRTMLCATRLATDSPTAGCKTLNRLEQVLARLEFVNDEVFEGLTLDAVGRVICGTMSNVFMVSNNSIATPLLDRCGVAGVMRRHVIETLHRNGTEVSIRDISCADLLCSDEVFLCNSQFGILPVSRCDEASWDTHSITRSLMGMLADSGVVECML